MPFAQAGVAGVLSCVIKPKRFFYNFLSSSFCKRNNFIPKSFIRVFVIGCHDDLQYLSLTSLLTGAAPLDELSNATTGYGAVSGAAAS